MTATEVLEMQDYELDTIDDPFADDVIAADDVNATINARRVAALEFLNKPENFDTWNATSFLPCELVADMMSDGASREEIVKYDKDARRHDELIGKESKRDFVAAIRQQFDGDIADYIDSRGDGYTPGSSSHSGEWLAAQFGVKSLYEGKERRERANRQKAGLSRGASITSKAAGKRAVEYIQKVQAERAAQAESQAAQTDNYSVGIEPESLSTSTELPAMMQDVNAQYQDAARAVYERAATGADTKTAQRLARSLEWQLSQFDATIQDFTARGKSYDDAASIWLYRAKLAASAKVAL